MRLKFCITDEKVQVVDGQQQRAGISVLETPSEVSKLQVCSVGNMVVPRVPSHGLAHFLERPQLIDNFTITAPGTTSRVLTFNDYVTSTTVAEKLKYFKLIRGKFHVRAEVALNPHYYGAALVSILRGPAPVTTVDFYRMLTVPGVFLDFNTSNSAELVIDIATPGFAVDLQAAHSTEYGADNAAMVYFTTFEPLCNDLGGAVPAQTVKFHCWMTDVELAGPTVYSTASGGRNLSEMKAALSETGNKPSLSRMLANRALDYMPPPMATAAVAADELGGAMAVAMGFSKPLNAPAPSNMIQRHCGTMSGCTGLDSSVPLTIDGNANLPLTFEDGCDEPDPLSYGSWCRMWGNAGSFTWNTTDVLDTQIAVIPVTPCLSARYSATLNTTPVGLVGALHTQWNGTIEIRLHCSATPYHRGRLGIFYAPNDSTYAWANTTTATQTAEMCILDVARGFDKTFRVAWTNAAPYLNCDPTTINPGSFNGGENGSIRVVVLTPLQASVAGSNLTISVWARGTDELDFQLVENTLVSGLYTASGGRNTTSLPDSFDTGELETSVCEFGAYAKTIVGSMTNYGEVHKSLRAVMKRYYLTMLINPNATLATISVNGGVMQTRIMWPKAPLIRDATVNTFYGKTVDAYLTPVTWVMGCFSAFRGGFRHKIIAMGPTSGSVMPINRTTIVTEPFQAINGAWLAPSYVLPYATGTADLRGLRYALQDLIAGGEAFQTNVSTGCIAEVSIRSALGTRYVFPEKTSSGAYNEAGFTVIDNIAIASNSNIYGVAYGDCVAIEEDFMPVNFWGVCGVTNGGPTYQTGTNF